MITFSKDSWHYRVSSEKLWKLQRNDRENLTFCRYARLVMYSLLEYALLGIVIVVFCAAAIGLPILGVIDLFVHFETKFWAELARAGLSIGIVLLVLVGYGAASAKYISWRKAKYNEFGELREPVKPVDGFFKTWYKSKIERICPMIEFK